MIENTSFQYLNALKTLNKQRNVCFCPPYWIAHPIRIGFSIPPTKMSDKRRFRSASSSLLPEIHNSEADWLRPETMNADWLKFSAGKAKVKI
jgi:hypothetical protein